MKQWPISRSTPLFPDSPGCFGVFRRHDRHTGVDLYCDIGTTIVAVEDGTVVKVEEFTGPEAGSPWWNRTQAVLIEGDSGVLVYGEVTPLVEEGQTVKAGEPIAVVEPVLKEFKGRPMVMLHFEQMTVGSRETLWWRLDQPQPKNLLDPTDLLLEASGDQGCEFFALQKWDGQRFSFRQS